MDMGASIGGSVNISIGTNNDTVFNNDGSGVGNAIVASLFILSKTKALRTNDTSRLENYISTDLTTIPNNTTRM